MTGRHFAAALVAAACLALTACGAAGSNAEGSAVTGSAAPGSSVPGSSAPVPGPAASGTPKPTQTPPVVTKPGVPNTATPFPGEMTVRGTVVAGVEINCMILKANDGAEYLLLGGDRNLIKAGKQLEVVGRPQPGLMTTCQQGMPFKVTQARAI